MKAAALGSLKKRSKNSFTLIEIIFTMGILALIFCAIFGVYGSCFLLISTSKNTNIAIDAATGLMDTIRTSSFARIFQDYNGLNFIVNDIPFSRGVVYVNNANPALLEVTISVCWRQGTGIIGEDANLNGTLEAGEDANGNGIIDSPVQMVTRIANR